MRYTVLLAQLGELSVLSHALHYAPALEPEHAPALELDHGDMFESGNVDLDELVAESITGSVLDGGALQAAGLVMDVGLDEEGYMTPEERAQAHAQKYAADFVVELNMTKAHDTGKDLGIVMSVSADFEPAMVSTVKKHGLIQEWNDAVLEMGDPTKQVLVGDEIIRVNAIQWHANSGVFVTRIAGQFKNARKQIEGTSNALKLSIQRPRDSQYNRFLRKRDRGQLDDVHNQEYAAEFTAEFSMPDDIRNTTLDSIMGWTVNITEEWKPAAIGNIAREGSVAMWNKEHPDKWILEGDELLKIDSIITFHHNASTFMSRLNQHFKSTQKAVVTNRTLLVHIQRPWPVQKWFDKKHPVEEIVESEYRDEYEAQLHFDAVGSKERQGWELDSRGPVQVRYVKQEGVVSRWNEKHPNESIKDHDEILAVNGDSFENYDSPREFSDKVNSTIQSARSSGPEGAPVRLTLLRPIRNVSYFRHNMENGVHLDSPMPDRYGMEDDDTVGES